MHRGRTAGFSIIEIMIAVAIIGIIAAIAIPQYRASVIRSKQAAAKAVLIDVAQKQVQFLVDNRTGYAGSLSALYITPESDVSNLYTFSISINSPPPTFVAKATPKTAEAGTTWFSIDQSGLKQTGEGSDPTATGTW
jgi:type IV pilus assembly protein PilE